MVGTDSQPQLPLSLSASTSGTSATATSTVPSRSISRGRSGSRDSFTVNQVSGTQSAAIAASIQNRPCQPVDPTRTPPISGPAAPPIAEAAPHSVIAFICPVPAESTDSRLIPQARIVEPAAPWIIRPAITPAAADEKAISAQETTKSTNPARKIRRRPKTSPSAPDVTITAAPTSM